MGNRYLGELAKEIDGGVETLKNLSKLLEVFRVEINYVEGIDAKKTDQMAAAASTEVGKPIFSLRELSIHIKEEENG